MVETLPLFDDPQEQLSEAYLKTHKSAVKGHVHRFGLHLSHGELEPNNALVLFRHHQEAYVKWTRKDGKFGERCYYHFKEAFKFLWPNYLIHHGLELEMQAFCLTSNMTVIGATRQSKTHGFARILFLDWSCRMAPEWQEITENGVKKTIKIEGTRTTICSSDLSRLISTLGRDIIDAIQGARPEMAAQFDQILHIKSDQSGYAITPMPEKRFNDTQNKLRKSYGIFGLGVSNADKEKIQGVHCDRRRMLYDEATAAPEVYFEAEEENVSNAPDYKGIHLANPTDRHCPFGQRCEPADGWDSIGMETETWWSKKRLIVRLDAFKSYNFTLYDDWKAGKIDRAEYERKLLPWMLSPEEAIYGPTAKYIEGTAPYFTYVRAMFLKDGMTNKVITSHAIEESKGEMVWDQKPRFGACFDPAYVNDDPVQHHFEYGKNRAGEFCIYFKGTTIVSTLAENAKMSVDKQMAKRVIDLLDDKGVKPEDYIQDTTGNGRSVYSHIQDEWDDPDSMRIQACEFGGKPTDRKLHQSDSKTAEEAVCYFVDEMWFRAAEWMRTGRVYGLENLDPRTIIDLQSREYYFKGNKQRLYDKAEVKKLIGRSPDFGDAFILAFELLARKGYIPSAKSINEDADDLSTKWMEQHEELQRQYDSAPQSSSSDWN